jgi:hypothetical protein
MMQPMLQRCSDGVMVLKSIHIVSFQNVRKKTVESLFTEKVATVKHIYNDVAIPLAKQLYAPLRNNA